MVEEAQFTLGLQLRAIVALQSVAVWSVRAGGRQVTLMNADNSHTIAELRRQKAGKLNHALPFTKRWRHIRGLNDVLGRKSPQQPQLHELADALGTSCDGRASDSGPMPPPSALHELSYAVHRLKFGRGR